MIKILKSITILLSIVMFITVVLGVFYRYVLRAPLFWSSELSTYLFMWSTMLGAYYACVENSHVRMSYLVEKLGTKARGVVSIIENILVLLFVLVLVKSGTEQAILNIDILTPSLRISLFFPYLCIPVASTLIGLETMKNIIKEIKIITKR